MIIEAIEDQHVKRLNDSLVAKDCRLVRLASDGVVAWVSTRSRTLKQCIRQGVWDDGIYCVFDGRTKAVWVYSERGDGRWRKHWSAA